MGNAARFQRESNGCKVQKYSRIMRSNCRGVAQPGSAPALGAGGPEFKSRRPDHSLQSDPSNFSARGRRMGSRLSLRGRRHLNFIAFAKGGLHCAALLGSRINIGAPPKVESALLVRTAVRLKIIDLEAGNQIDN